MAENNRFDGHKWGNTIAGVIACLLALFGCLGVTTIFDLVTLFNFSEPIESSSPSLTSPPCSLSEEDVANMLLQVSNQVELTSQLDRFWDNNSCMGNWNGSGFTVPAGAIFWTNLYDDRFEDGYRIYLAEGGKGVFLSSEPFPIDDLRNTGGRYIILEESNNR